MFEYKGGKNGGAERLAYVNLGQHKEQRSLQPTGNAWLKMIMMMANVALHFLFFKRFPDPNVETSEMEAMQVYEGSE